MYSSELSSMIKMASIYIRKMDRLNSSRNPLSSDYALGRFNHYFNQTMEILESAIDILQQDYEFMDSSLN